jgi:hypothetical protein
MNKQVKNSVNPLSILIDEHRMSLAIYSLVILTATGWTLSITTCMFLLAWQLLTETVATENGWEHYNRKQLLGKTVRNIQPVTITPLPKVGYIVFLYLWLLWFKDVFISTSISMMRLLRWVNSSFLSHNWNLIKMNSKINTQCKIHRMNLQKWKPNRPENQ